MPKKFTDCVKTGRVRTVKPKAGRYLHVCFPPGGGKSVGGEVKRTKKRGRG